MPSLKEKNVVYDNAVDMNSLITLYHSIRNRSAELAAPLSAEDQTVQSMPDASPTKWHLAHTTWFFETFILKEFSKEYQWFDEQYCHLFNSYYNGIGEPYKRAHRGFISRPGVDEVQRYRRHVDEKISTFLANDNNLSNARVKELMMVGVNHEQQHQELLLTDIKHALSFNPTHPAYQKLSATTTSALKNAGIQFHTISVGDCYIGAEGGYKFDNELPRHRVLVPDFKVANRLVTNAEYLEFVLAGGYENPLLWLSEGWAWVTAQHKAKPYYWHNRNQSWCEFTLYGLQALNPDSPACHINYYEADAFARWRKCRLLTEFEWEAAAQNAVVHAPQNSLHPSVASDTKGIQQLFGYTWQWTSSAYSAYPGYKPWAGAAGEYNGKFMINQMVLRGSSCATPAGHSRLSYRNFFPPDASWQFSGIRLAKDVD